MDRDLFIFLKDAYTNGLCDEYKTLLRSCGEDKLSLLRLSLRRQSIPWVATKASNGVLTREYLSSEYSDYINGYLLSDCDGVEGYTSGLYVDYPVNDDLVAEADTSHIMWTVGASVVIPNCKCPVLYVSNRSDLHIVCEGYNSIKVYLFDRSKVTIEDCDATCSVTVYCYSDEAKVIKGRYCLSEKVNVFNKDLVI